MTIQDALHAAIAGGWDFKRAEVGGILTARVAMTDRLFWESLGKTLGWSALNAVSLKGDGRIAWHQMWINLIDHLALGNTPDEFFKKLTPG